MSFNFSSHSPPSPGSPNSNMAGGGGSSANINSTRTAHEEATVEGVMNRWRVRPMFDNYSATVAPSAPDTMSIFLSLRADLLKSSIAIDSERANALASSSANNSPSSGRDKHKSEFETDDSSTDDEEDDEDTLNADGTRIDKAANVTRTQSGRKVYAVVSKSEDKNRRREERNQKRKDDYTVRQLKGELGRLLEQLQINNAETVQLKNQIAGMNKELSARQRRIADLEEVNRSLLEQNQQLQQSVAELGFTVNAVEESNMAHLIHTRAGPAASVMGGGGANAPELAAGSAASLLSGGGVGGRQRGTSMANSGNNLTNAAARRGSFLEQRNVHWQQK